MDLTAILFLVFVIPASNGNVDMTETIKSSISPENANLEGKQFPHETLCNLYYRYVYGIKIIKECPDGKLFNTQISNCDYNYNVDCDSRKSPDNNKITEESIYEYYDVETTIGDDLSITTTKQPSECPMKQDPYEPNPVIAHEDSCNHFYKCIDGNKYLMKCSGILQFNPKVLACDWPRNVRCK